ncbi:MAG: hypothetical protein JJT99_02010 [Rhodobacteraceae bacterium]|nr:hypothetical protein [Paracoccaceae bacterium]
MEMLFAMLIAKLLGIAGLGGLLSGLFIRSLPLALSGGVAAGFIGQIVLSSLRSSSVGLLSWIMAIVAGILAAAIGWLVRGRKISAK